jgi:hypothetical protein
MAEPESREKQRERMRAALEEKEQEERARAEEHSLEAADRPQDAMSVRAKSSGHKKKTADKWNQ